MSAESLRDRVVERTERDAAMDDLRTALRHAQEALDKEKRRTDELVTAIYRASHDAALALEMPPVPEPEFRQGDGKPEVAIAPMGDWQLGKITPSYNSEVCERRIEEYGDKVIRLTNIQRKDHPVRDLRVWLLGDMVEGEMIFPGQAHLIDSSVFHQAMRTGPRILGNFLRRMAGYFETVAVTAVIGNHGRNGRKGEFNLNTNWDRVLYVHTAGILEGRKGLDRLSWVIPEAERESSWYAVDRIGQYGSLLFHGYNLKGHAGFPWYGLGKKVGGWAMGAIPEFEMAKDRQLDVDFGHWHQPVKVPLNNVMARCNGSTESHNSFAQEQLAAVGYPSQGLRYVRPDKGMVTAEYTVWLQ